MYSSLHLTHTALGRKATPSLLQSQTCRLMVSQSGDQIHTPPRGWRHGHPIYRALWPRPCSNSGCAAAVQLGDQPHKHVY